MEKVKKLLTGLFFVFALHITLYTLYSYAGVPRLINYQGRLTDSQGVPLNGSYAITFRIYDSETAGSLLWEETHTGVVIQKGIFSVLLGSVTNLDDLPFNKQYYLEIKVGSEVMSPRQRITTSAYAFMAENVISIPRGIITMWSGAIAAIPPGWALCDGTNGTPDLRDRFIAGARQDEGGVAKTNVTGTITVSGDGVIPAHSHGAGALSTTNAGEHGHNLDYYVGEYNNDLSYVHGYPSLHYKGINERISQLTANTAGSHLHTIAGSTANTGSGTKNVAVYYALAFIMKL